MRQPPADGCHEKGCRKRVEWRVLTMGGWRPFCGEHADWYIRKGPSVYPVEASR
jgi:hypothetical protein